MRRFGEFPFVAATRDALPWSFIGLVAAFVVLLPFTREPGPFFGPTLGLRISSALLPAFGVMGAVLVPVLSIIYARRAKIAYAPQSIASIATYVLCLPVPDGGRLSEAYLWQIGPSGLFLALLVCGAAALAVTRFGATWRAYAAAAVPIAAAFVLREAHVSVAQGVNALLSPLAHLGDTYLALMLIVLIETLLWSCGMHGPALLAAVVTPVYLTLQMQNTAAYAHHTALPHIVVVSLFLFVFPGGAGATLPLAALLALSRVPRLRAIGRITLLPALFNTNEPLLFGAPVVFNPFLIPPFVVVPLILATLTYLAAALGWVNRPAFYVPSSIPTVASTYLATIDVRAIVLAIVNVAVATACYLPFVRAYERHVEEQP